MWHDYLVYLIAPHVIIKLLLDEIYPPLGISIWSNVDCSLLNDLMLGGRFEFVYHLVLLPNRLTK